MHGQGWCGRLACGGEGFSLPPFSSLFQPLFPVHATLAAIKLRQHRTNELVRWQMNFLSDAIADFAGLLAVNQEICKQQMAKKALPTLPTNCAVLP